MGVLCWGKCKQGSQVAKTNFRELSDRGGVLRDCQRGVLRDCQRAIVDGGGGRAITHPGPRGGGGVLLAWSDFREMYMICFGRLGETWDV